MTASACGPAPPRRTAHRDDRARRAFECARRDLRASSAHELGIWEAIAPKVVPTENVRGALAAVAAGNADAAIVYRTDARISKRVRVAFEVRDGPPISYPFALLTDRSRAPVLRLSALKPALDIFARHGFDVLR